MPLVKFYAQSLKLVLLVSGTQFISSHCTLLTVITFRSIKLLIGQTIIKLLLELTFLLRISEPKVGVVTINTK